MFKLNVRYIVKLLGMTHLLESFFMLAATGVAFGYGGCDFYPLLISTGIMSGTGLLLYLIRRKRNDSRAGRAIWNVEINSVKNLLIPISEMNILQSDIVVFRQSYTRIGSFELRQF